MFPGLCVLRWLDRKVTDWLTAEFPSYEQALVDAEAEVDVLEPHDLLGGEPLDTAGYLSWPVDGATTLWEPPGGNSQTLVWADEPPLHRQCLRCGDRYNCEHVCKRPDITTTSFSAVMDWMQRQRRTDVVVQCGHCRRVVGDAKAFSVHMLSCDLQPIDSDAPVPPGVSEGPAGMEPTALPAGPPNDERTSENLRVEAREFVRLSNLAENAWVSDFLEGQARHSLSLAIYFENEARGIPTAGNPAGLDVCLECETTFCGCRSEDPGITPWTGRYGL